MISIYPEQTLVYNSTSENLITSFLTPQTANEIHFYDLDYSITNLPNQADLDIGVLANFFGGNSLTSIYSIRTYFPTSSLFKIYRIILFSAAPGIFTLDAFKFIFQLNPSITYSYRELPNSWVVLFANNLPIAYLYQETIGDQEKTLILSLSSQTSIVLPLSQADFIKETALNIKSYFYSAVQDYLNIIGEGYTLIGE